MNGRGCGCIGTVDSRRQFAQSYNQIQTLKEYLSVTSIALIYGLALPRLLELLT